MGKKRKSNGIDLDHGSDLRAEQTNYNKDEEFLDSEDEFYAGRDQILLDDGPLNKRRKVNEDGKLPSSSLSRTFLILRPFRRIPTTV